MDNIPYTKYAKGFKLVGKTQTINNEVAKKQTINIRNAQIVCNEL